jgi:hypothetical protein
MLCDRWLASQPISKWADRLAMNAELYGVLVQQVFED